jgi:hypothetical protein
VQTILKVNNDKKQEALCRKQNILIVDDDGDNKDILNH